MMKGTKHLFAVLLSASVLVACGSTETMTVAGPSPVTATIEAVVFAFGEDLSSFTRVGATAQVTAVGVFSDGTMRTVTSSCIDWRSDNTRVLTVDGRGLMTAQSNGGSATIATTCQSVAARGEVTVNLTTPPPPRSPSAPNPGPGPPPSACPAPPYAWDPLPQTTCRGRDGRYGNNSCCGPRP